MARAYNAPMQRWCLLVLAAVIATTFAIAQSRFILDTDRSIKGGQEFKGLVSLEIQGKPVNKRFVIRTPKKWSGALVIGAHGGGGGNNFDRAGNVIGTDETALDDVIGRHALAHGFAYASVDRDGAGNGEIGLRSPISSRAW